MSNHDREGSRPSDRDDALKRAWRVASPEEPPANVDAAIIAAARKSVRDGGEQPSTVLVRIRPRRQWSQWQPLAAAAAVAGLAFVLVPMLPREHDLAPSMQRKVPASLPASAETQSSPRGSSANEATGVRRQEPIVDDAWGSRESDAPAERAQAQNEVPEPPTAAAPPEMKVEASAHDSVPAPKATRSDATAAADTAAVIGEIGAERRGSADPELADRSSTTATAAATATPSSPARANTYDNAASLDAQAWAAKVVALHETGDLDAAEHALRAFRAVEPDADSYLPDSLRSWARTVK